MSLITLWYIGISIGCFVFLLHHTDFLYSYAKLLGLQKFFVKYEEWKYRPENIGHYWPVFLREYQTNNKIKVFLFALIGCPICLSVFISLFLTGYFFLICGAFSCLTYLILAILYKFLNKLYI